MSRTAGDMQQQSAYFVGLDWGNARHTAAVASAQREIVARFSVANSLEGLRELAQRLHEWAPVAGVAVEATRDPVVLYLYNEGFAIYPVNPKVSKNWRAGLSPAESKSDGRDARMLAVELSRRHEELHTLQWSEPAVEEFAGLCRAHRQLIEQRANLVQQLKAVLKIYFPAALEFFSDWASPSAWRFIKRFSTPHELAKTRKSTLIAFLRANQIGLTPTWLERIENRRQAADWPLPPGHLAYKLQAMAIVAQLMALQPQIDKCARQIGERAKDFPELPLMNSLPGAGKHLAPALAAISLKTAGQTANRRAYMRAVAGVAPVENESGKRNAPTMRRRCNKVWRTTLHLFAYCSIHHCPWARAFYQLCRQRGDTYATALRKLADKWLRIINRMLETGQPYNEQRYVQALKANRSPVYDKMRELAVEKSS